VEIKLIENFRRMFNFLIKNVLKKVRGRRLMNGDNGNKVVNEIVGSSLFAISN
jgi:hypothetical protein